jgi:4-hydroxybenzoate polyprenyltransferase
VAFVTLLTTTLALAAGLHGTLLLWLALAVGAGQLAVGWSNDFLDRRLDLAAHRRDKPLARAAGARIRPATVLTGAVLALAASVPLSLAVSGGFAAAHLAAVGCALAYNLGLKATPLSVLPYAVAFGLLPTAVALGLPSAHAPPPWAIAAAALVGAGGHFTQALPDIPSDRQLGLRGLPQIVGQRASGAAAAALLLAANLVVAAVALAAGIAAPLAALHAAAAIALAAGILAAAATGRARLAFRLTLAAAALAVLAFLAGGSRL